MVRTTAKAFLRGGHAGGWRPGGSGTARLWVPQGWAAQGADLPNAEAALGSFELNGAINQALLFAVGEEARPFLVGPEVLHVGVPAVPPQR